MEGKSDQIALLKKILAVLQKIEQKQFANIEANIMTQSSNIKSKDIVQEAYSSIGLNTGRSRK